MEAEYVEKSAESPFLQLHFQVPGIKHFPGACTPENYRLEPKNHSIEKEHHWNHTYIVWVPS